MTHPLTFQKSFDLGVSCWSRSPPRWQASGDRLERAAVQVAELVAALDARVEATRRPWRSSAGNGASIHPISRRQRS